MSTLYHPTPLEEAYGLYLLETVFQISHNGDNAAVSSSVRISGRSAVPFFTKSHVDRLVLRNIWSTVDPNNHGVLETHAQFYASLRLIALAQVGVLQGQASSSTAAMEACAKSTQGQILPLPQFEGIVIPDATTLQRYYQQQHYHPTTTTSTQVQHHMRSVSDGMHYQHFSTLPQAQHVRSVSDEFGGGGGIPPYTPTPPPAVGFGAPLPPTHDPTTAGWNTTSSSAGSSAPVPYDASSSATSWNMNLSSGDPQSLAEVTSMTSFPATAASSTMDAFAMGPAATGTTVSNFASSSGMVNQTVSISDAFGDLVEVHDEPLPVLPSSPSHPTRKGESVPGEKDDDADEFGDFDGAAIPPQEVVAPKLAAIEPSNSTVDFDGGSLPAESAVPHGPTTTSLVHPLQHESSSNADDFGDFCGSDEFATAATAASPPPAGDASSTFASKPAATLGFGVDLATVQGFDTEVNVASGDWDALDALVDIPDAPLPPILPSSSFDVKDDHDNEAEAFSTTELAEAVNEDAVIPSADALVEEEEDDDDDEFGDFEAISMPDASTDAVDEPEPTPLATSEDASGIAVPQPTIAHTVAAPLDDDAALVGLFMGSSGETGVVSSTSVSSPGVDVPSSLEGTGFASEPPVVEGLSALDAFGELENAPLPSLSQWQVYSNSDEAAIAITDAGTTDALAQEDDSEGFGDFVGLDEPVNDATETESAIKEVAASTGTAAPASSGEDANQLALDQQDESDGFGDFVSKDTTNVFRSNGVASNDTAEFPSRDHFNSWGGPDPAHLEEPYPLERRSSAPTPGLIPEGTHKDAGGTSATTGVAPLLCGDSTNMRSASAPAPTTSASFDAFDGLPGTDQGLPPPQIVNEDEPVDDFTDFVSTVESAAGVSTESNVTVASKDDIQQRESSLLSQEADASDESEVNAQNCDAAASADALKRDKKPIPLTSVNSELLKSEDRLDSDYFSASGSNSDDLEGFESAIETDDEANTNERFSGFRSQADSLTKPNADSEIFNDEDPFAVFDALSAPPPVLPPLPKPDPIPPGGVQDKIDLTAAKLEVSVATSREEAVPGMAHLFTESSVQPEPNPPLTGEASESDTFGDFESAEFDSPIRAVEDKGLTPADNDITTAHQSAPSASELPVEHQVEMDDSFGDFHAPTVTEDATAHDTIDFTATKDEPTAVDNKSTIMSLTEVPVSSTDDDDFGDFASFSAEPVPAEVQPKAAKIEEAEKEKLLLVRQLVVDQSLRLPETLRRQTDDGSVDFGDCFDGNIGLDVPVSDERKHRTQTCLQLMARLASEPGSRLASLYWEQAMSIAHKELQNGVSLLQEAKLFNASDPMKSCRTQLEVYVQSLGELVRVSRSVVATIGDMLMLDPSALFTHDTFASSWCDLSLLKTALDIERQWKDIERLSDELCLTSKQETEHKLQTVDEIRQATVVGNREKHLCDFTLQPLSRSPYSTTMSPVQWKNRVYMACSANFLNRKCSFYGVASI